MPFPSSKSTADYGQRGDRLPASSWRQEKRRSWGGRIRTYDPGIQNPVPYRLATPQQYSSLYHNRCPGQSSLHKHRTDAVARARTARPPPNGGIRGHPFYAGAINSSVLTGRQQQRRAPTTAPRGLQKIHLHRREEADVAAVVAGQRDHRNLRALLRRPGP